MGRSLTRWLSAHAAVVGRGHERNGEVCQDFVAAREMRGGVVLALADGAGSARFAADGARIAVESALDLLSTRFDELLAADEHAAKTMLVEHALAQLSAEAERRALDVRDLSSTLLFVAIRGEDLVAGQVGDGLVAIDDGTVARPLFAPAKGEHANETVFVPSKGAVDTMSLFRGSSEGTRGFALMSDGSAESLFQRRAGTIAPALGVMWRWLDQHPVRDAEGALARSIQNVLRVETTDDCSLGLLRRVRLDAADLRSRSDAFLASFLECATTRSLRTRVRVAEAMLEQDDPASVARALKLSATTVRRHRAALRVEMEPAAGGGASAA